MATSTVKTMGNIAYCGGITLGKIENAPGRNHYHITNKAGDRRQIVIGKKKALEMLLTWHNEAKEAEAAEQAAAEAAYHAEQAAEAATPATAPQPTPAPEAEPAPAEDSAAQAQAELAEVATQADFQQWSSKWELYTLIRKSDGAALAAVAHWGERNGREIAEFGLDNGKVSYPYYDQIARYFTAAPLQPR